MSFSLVSSLPFAASISSLSLAPNHLYLGVSCSDASLHMYHIQESPLASLELSPFYSLHRSNGSLVNTTAATTDSTTSSTASTMHTKGINEIAWLCDSSALVSASDDTSLIVWSITHSLSATTSNPTPAKEMRFSMWRQLLGHTGPIFSVASAPRALWIASGSFDQTIRLWDPIQGSCLRVIPAHSDPVTSVIFDREGSRLFSASYDGLIRIWEAASGDCLRTLVEASNPPVSSVRMASNGWALLAASLDDRLRVWNVRLGRLALTLSGHVNSQYCSQPCFIQPRPDLYLILMGDEKGSLTAWHIPKMSPATSTYANSGANSSAGPTSLDDILPTAQSKQAHASPILSVVGLQVQGTTWIMSASIAPTPELKLWQLRS